MSRIKINISRVREDISTLRSNYNNIANIKNGINSMRRSMDSRILAKKNIASRLNSAYNTLNDLERKLRDFETFANEAMDRYERAEKNVEKQGQAIEDLLYLYAASGINLGAIGGMFISTEGGIDGVMGEVVEDISEAIEEESSDEEKVSDKKASDDSEVNSKEAGLTEKNIIEGYYNWVNDSDDLKYFNYLALLTPGSLIGYGGGIKQVIDAYVKAKSQLFNFIKGKGLFLERRGNYFIVHGSKQEIADVNIKGRRYSVNKLENYEKLKALYPETKTMSEQVGEVLHFAKGDGIINAVGIAVDVGCDSYNDFNNSHYNSVEKANHVAADVVVDSSIDVGNIAASTAIGAEIGTFVPVPVVGTLVGAAVGFGVGIGINAFTNAWRPFEGGTKSFSDEAKEAVAGGLNAAEKDAAAVGSNVSKGVSHASKAVSDFVGKGMSDIENCSAGKAISALF